jgi:iron(II)-dependent oxidoreductase
LDAVVAVFSVAAISWSASTGDWTAGAVAFGFGGCWFGKRWSESSRRRVIDVHVAPSALPPTPTLPRISAQTPAEPQEIVAQMLAHGRAPLLLREQIAETMSAADLQVALDQLRKSMAPVPAGEVGIDDWRIGLGLLSEEDTLPMRASVAEFWIDRHQVTNEQYLSFVASGGYGNAAFWHDEVTEHRALFVDRTGKPGPRYWRRGQFIEGQATHPVVGVSWYEAAAYARWAGKRLPTGPEWVRAASLPIQAGQNAAAQRRYPWGESLDRRAAHLWGTEPAGATCSVFEYGDGATPHGVHQLIGNVWEWSESDLSACQIDERVELPEPLKALRGGAFDTYFDCQATTQFQSGDQPLARRHNIGFRCVINNDDLVTETAGKA